MLDMVGFDVDQNSDWRKGFFGVDWLYCKIAHNAGDVAALPDGVLPRGSPVRVKKPTDLTGVEITEYQINPQDFIHRAEFVSIDGVMPEILGITMEPINLNVGQSFIGRVAMNGLVYANLEFPGGTFTDSNREFYKYAHPLPSNNPDYRTKLQINSSGYVQLLGDSVILGRQQPLFVYQVSRGGNTGETIADIYGFTSESATGFLVMEDAELYHANYKAGVPLVNRPPFVTDDIGICVKNLDGQFAAISNVGTGLVAVSDGVGSARSGTTAGYGMAKVYRLDLTGASPTYVPALDASGVQASVGYFNSSNQAVANGKYIQLKDTHGVMHVDVEDCPT